MSDNTISFCVIIGFFALIFIGTVFVLYRQDQTQRDMIKALNKAIELEEKRQKQNDIIQK